MSRSWALPFGPADKRPQLVPKRADCGTPHPYRMQVEVFLETAVELTDSQTIVVIETAPMFDNIYYVTVVVGTVVLWRLSIGERPAALARWNISRLNFLFLTWCALAASSIVPLLSFALLQQITAISAEMEDPLRQLLSEVGMLSGIAIGFGYLRRSIAPPASKGWMKTNRWLAGFLTFLASVPLTFGAGKAAEFILGYFGLPVESQKQLDLVMGLRSRKAFAAWAFVAVIAAPITEEIVFRAGLFRFFRGRFPRWATLSLPSALFAFLHVDLKTSK